MGMVDKVIKFLTENYNPDGFNIGINCGVGGYIIC